MLEKLTLADLFKISVLMFFLGGGIFFLSEYYKEKSAYSLTIHQLRQMQEAVYAYQDNHGGAYPDETDHSFSSAFNAYFRTAPAVGGWYTSPFDGGYYDWDNWEPDDLVYPPFEDVRQISIRFCNADGSVCNFPDEKWAKNFDKYSAVYLCLEGPCRAYASKEVTHPGYRVD